MNRHRDRLAVPFIMGIGGTLDVVGGLVRRAPPHIQRAGLEWAFRLAQEPRRLAWRYLTSNAAFAALMVGEAMRRLGRMVAGGRTIEEPPVPSLRRAIGTRARVERIKAATRKAASRKLSEPLRSRSLP